MKVNTVFLTLLAGMMSTNAGAAPQRSAPMVSDTTVQVSVQIQGERFPARYTLNQTHQDQQYQGHLLTKALLPDGRIKTTPNGWSMTVNHITPERVSLSVTFTEQEDSETFLFEKTPSNTPQCQSFPFHKAIVQDPVICISNVTTE